MAKKKDTLKDLNEFMKNQDLQKDAGDSFMDKKPTLLANIEKLHSEVEKLDKLPKDSLYESDIIKLIQKVAEASTLSPRHILFNIVEQVLAEQKDKDHIDILFENHVSFLKYHQLIMDKLNS